MWAFGLIICVAQFGSIMTAGFMGAATPLVFYNMGYDPASVAGPLETAFQDVVGYGVFLYLAKLLLPYFSWRKFCEKLFQNQEGKERGKKNKIELPYRG